MKAAILVFIVGNAAIMRDTLSSWEAARGIDRNLENTGK